MTDSADSSREQTLVERLQAIYADEHLTNEEFQALRDDADGKLSSLLNQYPSHQALVDFQRLADELVQAMQRSILDIKKTKPSRETILMLKEGFGYQLAYIKVCFDRFTQAM